MLDLGIKLTSFTSFGLGLEVLMLVSNLSPQKIMVMAPKKAMQ